MRRLEKLALLPAAVCGALLIGGPRDALAEHGQREYNRSGFSLSFGSSYGHSEYSSPRHHGGHGQGGFEFSYSRPRYNMYFGSGHGHSSRYGSCGGVYRSYRHSGHGGHGGYGGFCH